MEGMSMNTLCKRLMTLLFALMLVPAIGAAAEENHDYLITTHEELAAIADDPDGNYYLRNDIDLAGLEWTPIQGFTGYFDGCGYAINNLTINLSESSLDSVGLFSSFTGKVCNLIVKNADITVTNPLGECRVTVIGVPEPETSGYIEYCDVEGRIDFSYESVIEYGQYGAYGLCGASHSTADVDITTTSSVMESIECEVSAVGLYNCSQSQNSGNINASFGEEYYYGYGAVGMLGCSDCENNGNVTSTGGYSASATGMEECSGCINTGTISAGDGFFNNAVGMSECNECTNSGAITSQGRYEYADGIYNSEWCENTGSLEAAEVRAICESSNSINRGVLNGQWLTGIEYSTDCENYGDFKPRSSSGGVNVTPIRDDSYDATRNNNHNYGDSIFSVNSFNYSGCFNSYSGDHGEINVGTLTVDIRYCGGTYLYDESGNAIGNVIVRDEDITIYPKATTDIYSGCECYINFRDTDAEDFEMVNNGDINIELSGNKITLWGPEYNTGDVNIAADVSYDVYADISTIYNSGNITVSGEARSFQIGASDSLNEGNIIVNASGDSTVYCSGADYNTGNITVTVDNEIEVFDGTNEISVVGGYSLNEGEIYVNGSGHVEAAGTRGGVNYGNVSAYSKNGRAVAYGSDGGYEGDTYSYGKTYAESAKGEATAIGPTGTTIAKGYTVATARGGSCEATNTQYGVTAKNGTGYIIGTDHIDDDFQCNCGFDDIWFVNDFDNSYEPSRGGYLAQGHCGEYLCGTIVPFDGSTPSEIQKPGVTIPEQGNKPVEEDPEEEPEGIEAEIWADYLENDEWFNIENFTYACGSFLFEAKDCSYFDLNVYIRNSSGVEAEDFVLSLPEGFSFEEYKIDRSKELTDVVFDEDGEFSAAYTVYPIYSETMPEYVEFELYGDAYAYLEIPVTRDPAEGVVHCRNTKGLATMPVDFPIAVDTYKDYADMFMEHDVNDFYDKINELTCALTQAVYNETFIKQSLTNLGFTKYEYFESKDNHDVASVIAMKKIMNGDRVEDLMLVVMRGTYGTEWIGNFVVENWKTFGEHGDFRNAADNTLNRIMQYCSAEGKNVSKEDTQMLICGHSRAGAVVDLVAHDLNVSANCPVKELRAYTFAAPNSVRNGSADSNIFNYLYYQDFVGYVPAEYEKHGRTFVVGSNYENTEDLPIAIRLAFETYSSGQKYNLPKSPLVIKTILVAGDIGNVIASGAIVSNLLGRLSLIPGGPTDIPSAHGAEGYLAWVNCNGTDGAISYEAALESMNTFVVKAASDVCEKMFITAKLVNTPKKAVQFLVHLMHQRSNNGGAQMLTASCPVDVEVVDAKGTVVVSFASHELVSADHDRVFACSEGETDYMLLPQNEEMTVRITGNGEGSMKLGLVCVDEDTDDFVLEESEVTQRASYTDVPVSAGKTYQMKFTPNGSGVNWRLLDPNGEEYKPDRSELFSDPVYLPDALKKIEDEAYLGCTELTGTIVCPEGMTSIGAKAFYNSGISGIMIPESVESIAEDAFENASMTIYCAEGSAAYKYAVEHGIEVEVIPEE